MQYDIGKMSDKALCSLIENRFASSDTVWSDIRNIYDQNTAIYDNKAKWLQDIPKKSTKIQKNRIYVDMEAVINALIANPAQINFIPSKDSAEAQEVAKMEEMFFQKKYNDRNFKEVLRMALRNLYFGRLLVIKPFWNARIDDFDARAIDPRKIRISKHAKNEPESEFAIEEITDTIMALCSRFPSKKEEILKRAGLSEEELYIQNPEVTYKEAWIGDYLICKFEDLILEKVRNPYFDWDGVLVTEEEKTQLADATGKDRRALFNQIKLEQPSRKGSDNSGVSPSVSPPTEVSYESYYFNYFDQPRKPYIIATILNNENKPIGRTDMITLASTLQHAIDKRKMDIDENCELVNGIIKVDSTVMTKDDAQAIRYEAKGLLWGKGVATGVSRETGEPLPDMVFKDLLDNEMGIDAIMCASSAFKGERQGQETKAGRLALIQQSFQQLNELIQVVDYASLELFGWCYQLAKTRYTEPKYAKWMGKDGAAKVIGLIQDDFVSGTELTVIPGKSLPQDAEFRFERAQKDVETGIIAPPDYLEEAGYFNPKQLAQNAVLYKQNPAQAVGLDQADMPMPAQPGQFTPQQQAEIQAVMPQEMPV